ncbi:LURP-one-related/scramblase family protein [Nocardiopsis suaedae]|uniref:LURP-one-related family protein n=1 Tax=Nocardiopsis suaedae TaxID=3018444 RepID=A0ABT4TRX0_9ACTN|nr:LURP-one-related family protein [Nocardiopsis suaedae]MDA2807428.1 LURP-one-related family protein [Nocardiopsis suaedae]
MKLLVRERIFDIGDDFWVTDENGERAFWVDGKALRLRTTFELKDPEGRLLLTIREKKLAIRDTMRIERDGGTVATVRRNLISPFRDRLTVELEDGTEWEVAGDLLDKEYAISDQGGPVASISRKWFSLRDTYAVDVNTYRTDAGGDPALVTAVAVAVDAIGEERREEEEED